MDDLRYFRLAVNNAADELVATVVLDDDMGRATIEPGVVESPDGDDYVMRELDDELERRLVKAAIAARDVLRLP